MVSRPLFTSSGMHFIWLGLWMTAACFFSPIASAQVPVNVEITGINQTLETNVRLLLSIEQQKDHPLITVGRLQRLHQKAIEEIATALQPFGYYRPLVDPNLVKSDAGEWQATYAIDLGPALPIDEFNFLISPEMGQDPECTSGCWWDFDRAMEIKHLSNWIYGTDHPYKSPTGAGRRSSPIPSARLRARWQRAWTASRPSGSPATGPSCSSKKIGRAHV